MKKRNLKKVFISVFLVMSLVVSMGLPVYAADDTEENDTEVTFTSVIMNVGADETKRNITWYSECAEAGEVRYVKASEMNGENFPDSYKSSPATVISTTKTGYYSYKATMSGLEENTSYVYCMAVGENISDIYTFEVKAFSDEYSFTLISDPQVSTYGGPSWSDTLQKIKKHFPDSSFIVSAGDQLETPTDEVNYDNFIVSETAETAISITLGTSHDNAQPYKEHYNITNLSSGYGVSEITSDYYYKYNSTLFIHLNVESTDAESHAAYVERIIKNNPDCIWQVVVIHYSLYSGAGYSKNTELRDTLSGVFAKNGVDVVLSGHNHIYARSELISDVWTVSDDVITDNTVTDPEGTLYICAAPSTTAPGFGSSAESSEYTAKQAFEERKSVIVFDMSETSMTMNSYYVDKDEPELFDTFTIYHSAEKVRLNKNTDMLELSEEVGETRTALVGAYDYEKAIVKVVDGFWAVSEDDGETYTSLGIASEASDIVLSLNEESGYWELSEDGGESFTALPVNVNRYTVTYVTDTEISGDIDISAYPKQNVAADELPDDVVLTLPQGSIEDGVLYDWEWKYYSLEDGSEVSEFVSGGEYAAYLSCEVLCVSDTLYIANETKADEGIYSWSDAWDIVKRFTGTEFTLSLAENVTLTSEDSFKLASAVNVVIDLAGCTMDSTAVSNLIVLDQGTDTSDISIITSKSGGTLTAASVFFLSSGGGTTLNLTVGGENSEAVAISGNYLVNADNNFKNGATLYLDINEGTYELANALLRVDNYKTDESRRNSYYVTVENADIYTASSPIYFRTSGYGFKSCLFKAKFNSAYSCK